MTKLSHTTRIEADLLNELCCYQSASQSRTKSSKAPCEQQHKKKSLWPYILESSYSKIQPYIRNHIKQFELDQPLHEPELNCFFNSTYPSQSLTPSPPRYLLRPAIPWVLTRGTLLRLTQLNLQLTELKKSRLKTEIMVTKIKTTMTSSCDPRDHIERLHTGHREN